MVPRLSQTVSDGSLGGCRVIDWVHDVGRVSGLRIQVYTEEFQITGHSIFYLFNKLSGRVVIIRSLSYSLSCKKSFLFLCSVSG